MNKVLAPIFLAMAFLLAGLAPSYAQATRTWVSGVGDDANPCSRTAPCKTFAGAISKTAAGGEISVLDPGGFGAVTITKSISIVSEGSEGGILATGTNGVIVNALPTDVVNLHGLFFEGAGSGLAGVKVLSAKSVHIRNCLIRDFKGSAGTGMLVVPTSATVDVNVYVSNCTMSNNMRGVASDLTGGTAKAQVFLDRTVIDNSANSGILSKGANSVIFMTNSAVTKNAAGLSVANGGTIVSFGNNAIAGNTADGAPTSTLPLK